MAETPFSPQPEENGPSPTSTPATSEGAETAPSPVPEESPAAGRPEEAVPGAEAPPAVAIPVEAAQPESPRPEAEPEPGITATLEVPALEATAGGAGAEGGGEFDLLLEKIRDWFDSGELKAQWQRLQGPLKGLAILVGVVLLLRVYGSLIHTLDSLPLVGGLLELVGLITLTRFSLTRLVRKSDREQVFSEWRQRWNDFRGKT